MYKETDPSTLSGCDSSDAATTLSILHVIKSFRFGEKANKYDFSLIIECSYDFTLSVSIKGNKMKT